MIMRQMMSEEEECNSSSPQSHECNQTESTCSGGCGEPTEPLNRLNLDDTKLDEKPAKSGGRHGGNIYIEKCTIYADRGFWNIGPSDRGTKIQRRWCIWNKGDRWWGMYFCWCGSCWNCEQGRCTGGICEIGGLEDWLLDVMSMRYECSQISESSLRFLFHCRTMEQFLWWAGWSPVSQAHPRVQATKSFQCESPRREERKLNNFNTINF